MAEQPYTPENDPIVSKSYAAHYVIAMVLLTGSLFWALWDEAYGQRPWKGMQHEFKERYAAFLDRAKAESATAEQEIKSEPAYQRLEAEWKQAEEAAKPRVAELQAKLADVSSNLAPAQRVYTDRRARVNAWVYEQEIATSESKKASLQREIDDYKKETMPVSFPGGTEQLDYPKLEERYNALKTERAALNAELGNVLKPVGEAQQKAAAYVAERMVSLSPSQMEGLRAKVKSWDPRIVQINVMEANLVDRCQSCHIGVSELTTGVKLTPAMLAPQGGEADSYARAFTGHPSPELLQIHDPQVFGCSSCHGGNGRATSSVVKGHGRHKYWLWPLWDKENVEAGCQSCHAKDMFLATAGTDSINYGKELFMERGCVGCHRYEGYDREPEQYLTVRQQIRTLEAQKKDNLRQAEFKMRDADDPNTSQEMANRLNREALALRVGVSTIDAEIDQLDAESKGLLRDMKKVGPNLKDIRAKLNRNWIPEWIRKPTDFRPTTKMPNFRLSEDQIKAIAAYLWQAALTDTVPKAPAGDAGRGKELFETRGCMGCHSIGEGDQMQGGDFAGNLSRLGEKANYDYIVRWVHNPRQRLRPYCPYEKKDIGPEDYAKKGLPYVFDYDHSTCPNDGHELQVQQMTVMPSLRLSPPEAADIASFLMTQRKREPSAYADASYMDDPKLKEQGRFWVRHFGCAGCHEISGFEDEGRIGTELTAEGEKPLDRLDFALLTHDAKAGIDPFSGEKTGKWLNHKGFFTNKLTQPNIYDKGKVKGEMEKLRMPDPHLKPEQIKALVTFLLGSQQPKLGLVPLPATYTYAPDDQRRDVQDGWWIVKKYNCMGCHQFVPGQQTSFTQMTRYQDPDWKEQLPPTLMLEGARVDPNWLMRFLSNPSLTEGDIHRNGVRPYLRARMPTFFFSENELRKLVRFFQASAQQPAPYIPQKVEALTAREMDMARSLFTSVAAPCLRCHATGDPAHDRTATAPNFLLAKERLKAGWMEHWLIDPQSISPGTSMPSGLFRREGQQWVFSGPVPASFQGYDKDHTKLLVRYMLQLTAEEQRRVSGRTSAASSRGGAPQPAAQSRPARAASGSGSR